MNASRKTAARYVAASVALTTVPNVELLEVGEDWATSTGMFTWDVEHLQSAIASQDDPMVRTPVVKLGHVDPRFDGQPTLGRIENLHLTNNDQTLVGDLTGVPVWLADCMPSAFPRRSIEGWFDYGTRTGNSWPFVLTGVALLGSAYPAITCLEDIPLLYGIDTPELVPVDDVTEVAAMHSFEGTTILVAASSPEAGRLSDDPDEVAAKAGHVHAHTHSDGMSHSHYHSHNPSNLDHTTSTDVVHAHTHVTNASVPAGMIAASASVDDVRMAFYDGPGGEPGRYWWWIREVDVDPPQLIVDDDEGHLYRVGYAIDSGADGPSAVTFDDPQEVRIQYQDVPAVAAMAARFGNPVAAGRPRVRAAATHPTQREGVTDVNLSEETLRMLGLEPGATEDQINAALQERLSTPPEPTPTPTPAPAPEQPALESTPPAPAPTPEPAPESQVPDGAVLVDAAQWAETQRNAAAAADFLRQRDEERRNNVLDTAVKAGKFPPSRRDHYAALMKADPEGTAAMIQSLASGLVPVQERGRQGGEQDEGAPLEGEAAYPPEWKNAVAATKRSSAGRIKVATD